jgi:hypothetical protein
LLEGSCFVNRIPIRRTAMSALGLFVATGTVAGVSAFASDSPAASEAEVTAAAELSATAQDPRVVVPARAQAEMVAEKRVTRDYLARQAAAQKAARDKAARDKAAREKAAREKAAAEQAAREARERRAREAAASRSSRSSSRVSGGSPRSIARAMVADRGWSSSQFSCLDRLWQKESNWRVTATNPSSGAYGIPQSLPGRKMSSAGSDWRTNPATQIKWGLGYIADRYGTPCGAWSHSQSNNWY